MNNEVKRIDLRNVSKHLTSRGKSLYGYTKYDEDTKAYTLNEYGRRWIEQSLIKDLEFKSKRSAKNKSISHNG